MFKTFAIFFALVAVAFAAPKAAPQPQPQLVAAYSAPGVVTSNLAYSAYPGVAYSAYPGDAYAAPLAYSAYNAYPAPAVTYY